MDKKVRYQIITVNSWRIIAKGFTSQYAANKWGWENDYGQYDNDGGWTVDEYVEET